MLFMLVGVASFELVPRQLLGIFSDNAEVLAIGVNVFHLIGLSFIPAATAAAYPTEVTVGGATIFVTDVERFEKI